MPATIEDIERFRQFALDRVKSSDPAPELDELLVDWYDAEDQTEFDEGMRQAIADMNSGAVRPAREATADIFRRLGLPDE